MSVSGATVDVLATILVIIGVFYTARKLTRRNGPPTIWGWMPWLGDGVQFSKGSLTYIKSAKQKYGPVFTVLAAGKYLTFLMDVDDHREYFFNSKNVDFQQAVVDAVQNASLLSSETFLKHHTAMHDVMKGRLAPSQHHNYYANLSEQFSKQIRKVPDNSEQDLMQFTRRVMFGAVVTNLFGNGIAPDEEKMQELEDMYVKFDDQFEYGTQVPAFFLRDWSTCQQLLLKKFQNVQKGLKPQSSNPLTLVEHLMSLDTDIECGANFALMLLWASQANAIPLSFWVIAFLQSHPAELKKVYKELEDVFGDRHTDLVFDEDVICRLPSLKRCILETIRLRSPGVIARKVIRPFDVKGYTIPAGDMLMISPFWAHRDPRYFSDPDLFKPDRWLEADFDKNIMLDGFIAFGGGRYQCPGRWFAVMEMQIFIGLVLQNLSITSEDPLPNPSPIHVVGTQHPVENYKVRISKRF